MQSLTELALQLETGTLNLRGKSVPCRAVCAAQAARLTKLFARPTPPMVQDPSAGSLAPKIADYADVGYRRQVSAWEERRMVLEVVLSMLSIDELPDAEFAKRLGEEADRLEAVCIRTEIARLYSDLFAIGNRDDAEARKALVVDASTELVSIADDPIPEKYAETVLCAKLRIAERFGQDPVKFCDSITPGWLKMLLVYEKLRIREDSVP